MKKSLSILVILFAGIFAFTSCDKVEEVEPGTNPNATISGYVYANLDATDGDLEKAPQGTKVFFRINAQDLVLNPQPGYVYQTLQYETTINVDGMYSITLPTATHQAVPVTIQADQFEADQQVGAEDFEDVVFHANPVVQATQANQKYYTDIVYN
jgi:hypothetical protein